MNSCFMPLARKSDIVVQETSDEVLVYDLISNKAVYLNNTSALVWQSCDGKKSIGEIADILSVKTRELVSDELVSLAVTELAKHKLLQNAPGTFESFAGMSRREVIRKVGLGAVIALPLVSSLVAPTAAHANSLCLAVPNGCTCTMGNNGDECTTALMDIVVPCADSINCRCVRSNNGGGAGNGSCLP